MSGPGQPLMLGIVASAALLIAFLLGFELGQGEQRTVVVSDVLASESEPTSSGTLGQDAALLQPAMVDQLLQQAYYANHQLGSWVVCQQRPALACQAVAYSPLDPGSAFQSAAAHWLRVKSMTVQRGARTYLMGDISRLWMADAGARPVVGYHDVQGVTLNGAVQYYDLGYLDAGRYVIVDQSLDALTAKGPVTLAIGLTVE
jgi:hypothetical protein